MTNKWYNIYPWSNDPNNNYAFNTDFPANTGTINGVGAAILYMLPQNYTGKYYWWDKNGIGYDDTKTWPYSASCIHTKGHYDPYTHKDVTNHDTKFGYGYYEIRAMIPEMFNPHCFGDVYDVSWWMFDGNKNAGTSGNGGIDWGEIDFFEITNSDNQFSCNAHIIEPYGYDTEWKKNTHDNNSYHDPALTWFSNVDLNWTDISDPYWQNTLYRPRYLSDHIDNNWHVYGCEWMPDQIKIYIDHQLFFRLEGDFAYEYTDIYGSHKTVHPVHELNLKMPMGMAVTPGANAHQDGHCGEGTDPTQFYYYIDYFRYFKLRKDCNNDFIRGTSGQPFNFRDYGWDEHRVHGLAKFGENGCTTCSAKFDSSPGTKSVRASEIIFEDGFEITGEADDFYACDVDCNAITE